MDTTPRFPLSDEPNTGDTMHVSVGAGASNVAAGKDITQIIGYTAEQVSVLIAQVRTADQPRTWDGRIPYIGLTAFQEADAEFFFGREALVDMLLERVQRARFLCIAGPSGSGKSSLVQAGLIHSLRMGRLDSSRNWLYASLSPRSDPIEQLALAMARVAGKPEVADYLRERGADEPNSLHQQVETLLGHAPAQRFVLYVDQFEELFTQTKNEERRTSFLALLTTAINRDDGRITVIISMRSDFLSQCAAYPALLELINQQFQLVGAMSSQELALAILKPALAVGAEIEPDLVAQVIADMKGEPGALPLMQFALKDLFDAHPHKRGEAVKLTLSDYADRGGIQEALERYANATFAQFNGAQQEIARVVFSHLIEVGRGTLDTRRTATYDELITTETGLDNTVTVINALADARLVTTDTTEKHRRTLTVAHETLIEAWPWLRQLVDKNREAIALQNDVAGDAAEWDRHGWDPSYLYTGAKLATVREQLADKRIALSGSAKAFVEAAEVEAEARRAKEEAAHRRELAQAQALAAEQRRRAEEQTQAVTRLRRRNQWLAGALAAALLAVVLALVFYLQAQQNAEKAQVAAIREAEHRVEAEEARELAESEKLNATNAEATAVANAAEAVNARATADANAAEAETKATESEKQARYARALGLAADEIIMDELRVSNSNNISRSTTMLWIRAGDGYLKKGLYEEAQKWYEWGLKNGTFASPAERAQALAGIADVNVAKGDIDQAMSYYEEALNAVDGQNDRAAMAGILSRTSKALMISGDYAVAWEGLDNALHIQNELGDKVGAASTLTYFAELDSLLGIDERSTENLLEAMKIQREGGDSVGYANTETKLAELYIELGLTDHMDYARSLLDHALDTLRSSGNQVDEARTLTVLGNMLRLNFQNDEALNKYQQALKIQQDFVGDRYGASLTLNGMGMSYADLDRNEEALRSFQQALDANRVIDNTQGEVAILVNLGYLAERNGNLNHALEFYMVAVDKIESSQHGDKLPDSYLNNTSELFDHLIAGLWRDGKVNNAFDYTERAIALFGQFDFMPFCMNRRETNQIVEQAKEIRDDSIEIQNMLLDAQDDLSREQARSLDQQSQESSIDIATMRKKRLIDKISQVAEMYTAFHQYYATLWEKLKLTCSEHEVDTLRLESLQKEILDAETTLIEYYVLGERTLVWIIDNRGIKLVNLDITSDDLNGKIEFMRASLVQQEYDAGISGELFDNLFAPLKPYIKHTNLIIVPHSVLHDLPFAALWDAKSEHYLVQDYAITYAPSATALKFLLGKHNVDQGQMLAIGNPDGSQPHVETEVAAVADLYETKPLVQMQATESQVYSQVGPIDILHLAAHCVYDPDIPLFTRIELARDYVNDGNLEVHEIWGLDLNHVNLYSKRLRFGLFGRTGSSKSTGFPGPGDVRCAPFGYTWRSPA